MSFVTSMVLAGLMAAGPADAPVVPPGLQAALLAKVLKYDRNFEARAGTEVRVLVVRTAGAPESERVAAEYLAALRGQPLLGGVAHREAVVDFTSEATLAEQVRAHKATVVIVAPELAARAAQLASALDGLDCLTVSMTPEGVREGLVLGFDLKSGTPRMLFNLSRSRRQGTDFRADLLQLMTVFP